LSRRRSMWNLFRSALLRARTESLSEQALKPQASHGMRGLVSAKGAGEIVFNFLLGVAAILIAELHADAGGPLALRALWRHPNHASGDRQLFFLAHEVQQHEHFIAQPIIAVRGDEQSTILDERHVGEIQRALVLDGKRQQTRFITWTSQFR
jgi:hypothetical protein